MPKAKKGEPKKKATGGRTPPRSVEIQRTNFKTEESLQSKQLEPISQAPNSGSRREKFREYLTRNKIFFETITAAFLTFMAIVVAVGQLIVTREQTAYLKQQTKIEYRQATPQFSIITKQDANFPENDNIFIYNYGNIALNVSAETAVFYQLTYINKANQKDVLVPIVGYYWIHIPSDEATGIIMTIQGDASIKKWSLVEKGLDELTTDDEIINFEVIRYLKLSYTDIFNDKHTDYYQVVPFSGGELLTPEIGVAMFEQHKTGGTAGMSFDIDKVTAQDLYNLLP